MRRPRPGPPGLGRRAKYAVPRSLLEHCYRVHHGEPHETPHMLRSIWRRRKKGTGRCRSSGPRANLKRAPFLERPPAPTAALAWPSAPATTRRSDDLAPIFTEIEKRHDEAVSRLQEWIRQPSIAAENRCVNEGCE